MKLGLRRRKTDVDDQKVLFEALYADLQPDSVDLLWSWIEKYVPKERLGAARKSLDDWWSKKDD